MARSTLRPTKLFWKLLGAFSLVVTLALLLWGVTSPVLNGRPVAAFLGIVVFGSLWFYAKTQELGEF